MSPLPLKTQTPEEDEVEKKLAELKSLEMELVQRELELRTLSSQLQSFNAKYTQAVGHLIIELDQLEAQIAVLHAQKNPDNHSAQKNARRAWQSPQETEESSYDFGEGIVPREFTPSKHIKELYREAAKLIHPDLITDEEEKNRRSELMAEANRAYAEGDEAALKEIIRLWKTRPTAIQGETVSARLIHTIKQIAQVRKRLEVIAEELKQYRSGHLFELFTEYEKAKVEGRDLFGTTATKLTEAIELAKKVLADMAA
jgi:hypothetical protein